MGRRKKVEVKTADGKRISLQKISKARAEDVKKAVLEISHLEADEEGNPYPQEVQDILKKPSGEIPRYIGDKVIQAQKTIINKRNMLRMLLSTMGILGTACSRLQINYSTVQSWIRDDPEFAKIYEIVREYAIDFAESSLFYLINQKDNLPVKFAATRYYLATKGKKRGYIESTHSIVTDDQPIHIERTIIDPVEPSL